MLSGEKGTNRPGKLIIDLNAKLKNYSSLKLNCCTSVSFNCVIPVHKIGP